MGGRAFGGKRVPIEVGLALATQIVNELVSIQAISKGCVCGSIRRGLAEVGDVDLVVLPFNDFKLNGWLAEKFGMQKDKQTAAHQGLIEGVQVDVLVASEASWGAALMHCTGSKELNVRQRMHAKRKKWTLNEKGLFEGGQRIAGSTEEEVYAKLGLPFKEPRER